MLTASKTSTTTACASSLSAVNYQHQQCPSSPLFGGEPVCRVTRLAMQGMAPKVGLSLRQARGSASLRATHLVEGAIARAVELRSRLLGLSRHATRHAWHGSQGRIIPAAGAGLCEFVCFALGGGRYRAGSRTSFSSARFVASRDSPCVAWLRWRSSFRAISSGEEMHNPCRRRILFFSESSLILPFWFTSIHLAQPRATAPADRCEGYTNWTSFHPRA